MDVDVLIVGLGPAGATVLSDLVRLAGSELSILAIDHKPKPGFPVQCGEFMPSPEEMVSLMPDISNGREFFTFDDKFISNRTNTISFFSPEGKVIQTPFQGYSLHRGNWNTHLIEEGEKNGAEVWTSACAVNMKNTKVTVTRNNVKHIKIKPRVIVGADGVNSRVAQWTGLAEKRTDKHFVIVKQHLMTNIENEYDPTDVQMFFGEKYAPGAYAWIIPKSDNTANVGAGIRLPMLKNGMNVSKALFNLINVHPTASQILKDANIEQTIAGVVPVGLPFKKTVDLKTQTILVGDAACQVVSSVGGGIPPSMVAGSIAAKTIVDFLNRNCSLDKYQTEWHDKMLKVLNRAYKLRKFFDKISIGKDSRIQWYMNRLGSNDISKVVHCAVPWKLSLVDPFINYLNWIVT
ncbi:MAG: geranylgeranyl reductase family protein [Candidatus Hodarchaeales archaeon]|jgi:digeranylgeranylglycerophospholipid reductase